MGFIRTAMKGLKDVGRKLVMPGPSKGGGRRGRSKLRTITSVKHKPGRYRRDNPGRLH